MPKIQARRATRHALAALATAIALLAAATPAQAANRQWSNNCSGTFIYAWNDGNCWTNGLGPQPGDTAFITLGAAPAGVKVVFSVGTLDLDTLIVNGGAPVSPIWLYAVAGQLGAKNAVVGDFDYGSFTVGGPGPLAGNFHGGALTVGARSAAWGQMFVDHTLAIVEIDSVLTVGDFGRGNLQHSAGLVNTDKLLINRSGPLGALSDSYQLQGGRLNIRTDLENNGLYTQTGGTLNFEVGSRINWLNRGTLQLNGGAQTGAWLDNAGTVSATGGIKIDGLLNRGQMPVVDNSHPLTVGARGAVNQSTLTLSGGLLTVDASFENAGNAAKLNGHGVLLLKGQLINGQGAQVNVFGGDLNLKQGGMLNLGAVKLDSSSAILNNDAAAVVDNRGSLNLNGGRIYGAGSTSNAAAGAIFGGGSIETVFANKGLVRVDPGAPLTIDRAFTNNGTVQLTGSNGNAFGNGQLHGGLIRNAGGAFIQGTGIVHNAIVNEAGGELLVDAGLDLVLLGSYEAQQASITRVGATSRLYMDGPTLLRSGSLLLGTGLFYFGSTLDVGASPGRSKIEGNATFNGNSIYTAEIGGTQPDIGYDQLFIGQQLRLEGGTLRLKSFSGFVAQLGQRFDLFDFASETGSFGTIDASGLQLAPGTRLDLSQLYVDGSVSVTAVPEPATWLTLAAGIAVVAGRRRVLRTV